MTQSIRGYRPSPWELDPIGPPDAAASSAPSRHAGPPPTPVTSHVPATGPTARWLIPIARAQTPSLNPRYARLQRALDAFQAAMTPTYRTRYGDVNVSATFRMNGVPATKSASELETVARRAHVPFDAVMQCRLGRGNPEQIHALTQALIDQGKLEPAPGEPLRKAVREMMQKYGIGVDCAGYVQQALLHATGLNRAGARLRSLDNEDLSGLARRGYRRVDAPSDVRPGDLVELGAPVPTRDDPDPDRVGHRAIVYDQHVATAADMRHLLTYGDAASAFSVGGPIRVLDVDSSWGCGGLAELGGVQRERWWYNEATRDWGWLIADEGGAERSFVVTPTPYGHPIAPPNGMYRDAGTGR